MLLILPAETVHVDTGRLHTVVRTIRDAYLDGTPFRPEIARASGLLKESLVVPLVLEQPTVEVYAEPLWWVTYAADQYGNDHSLSPVGPLFTAVDELALALEFQAPRTDRGLVALLDAEWTVAIAAHTHNEENR